MKLTYCSFVDSDRPLGNGLFQCTVVILEGHLEPLDAANLVLEQRLLTGGTGEFFASPIPEELEAIHAPHTNRAIPAEEARVLFAAKSVREWQEEDASP